MDKCEERILEDFDEGQLRSIATKQEVARMREAAQATQIRHGRGDVPLSESKELRDPE